MRIQNLLKSISIAAILTSMPAMASAQDAETMEPMSYEAGAAEKESGMVFGAGVSLGSSGATAEGKVKISDYITLRGSYNFFETDQNEPYDGIVYDGTVDFSTLGAFADVHPFKNGFALTGGAFFGEKTIALTASPTNSVEIGGQTFTPEQAGDLTSTIDFGSFAAFGGLGYDNFGYTQSNISFNIRAGVMFMDEPASTLTSSNGVLSDDPIFQAELAAERQKLETELEDFRYFPVFNVGLAYQF